MKITTILFLSTLFFCSYSNAQNVFPDIGNVGIGTTTPEELLHIKSPGSIHATIESESSNAYWLANVGGNNGGGLRIDNLGVPKAFVFWTNHNPSRFGIWVNGGHRLTINNDGRVGIGTIDTGTHRLAVEGTLGAREVFVEPDGWSDFVFEKNYRLRPLEEVEEHIQEKGHLPEIPSAKEVEEEGIKVGEMNAKLLQKIEELTLYLIEQNKEIKELKEKIKELENK